MIGGAAIVAALIFVGLEVRENTQVSTLTLDRMIDQQSVALNRSITASADFADILVRGEQDRDSFSPAELARFGSYENLVGDFAAGSIGDKEFDLRARHFEFRCDKPGYRQFRVAHRNVYFESLRQWADERYGIAAD